MYVGLGSGAFGSDITIAVDDEKELKKRERVVSNQQPAQPCEREYLWRWKQRYAVGCSKEGLKTAA